MSSPALNERISSFYDESSPIWLDTWGEHMHHGYYGPDGKERKSRQQAQRDLISETLRFADLPSDPGRILDAGCGVGGSARHLALRYGADVLGLTLSEVQVQRGREINRLTGLDDRVELRRADLTQHIDPNGFDLVWSLESAEHVADKPAMLRSFYDLLRPGGTLALVTWCRRPTPPPLSTREEHVLRRLRALYHLPAWIAVQDYERHAKDLGFVDYASADWSAAVSPFWTEVLKSALSLDSLRGLIKAGIPTLKGAYAMRYMLEGYRSGLVKFGVMRMRKPAVG